VRACCGRRSLKQRAEQRQKHEFQAKQCNGDPEQRVWRKQGYEQGWRSTRQALSGSRMLHEEDFWSKLGNSCQNLNSWRQDTRVQKMQWRGMPFL
jgi:hypothetical protein